LSAEPIPSISVATDAIICGSATTKVIALSFPDRQASSVKPRRLARRARRTPSA
jgi:hypothetical protein